MAESERGLEVNGAVNGYSLEGWSEHHHLSSGDSRI